MLFLSLFVVAVLAFPEPPKFPVAFLCTVDQHKWNQNALAVDHYYKLTWYQDQAAGLMRVDGIFFGNQNSSDPTLPISAGGQISITDFRYV